METLRITTPEGKVYKMPNQPETRRFYEMANARKNVDELKYKIEVVNDSEPPAEAPVNSAESVATAETPVEAVEPVKRGKRVALNN